MSKPKKRVLKSTRKAPQAKQKRNLNCKKRSVTPKVAGQGNAVTPYKDRLTRDYEAFKREESKYRQEMDAGRRKAIGYANQRDDEEIKQLSQLLGIKNTEKTSRAFCMDGLDELLDVCRDSAFDSVKDIGTAWMEEEDAVVDAPEREEMVDAPLHRRLKKKKVTFASEPEFVESLAETNGKTDPCTTKLSGLMNESLSTEEPERCPSHVERGLITSEPSEQCMPNQDDDDQELSRRLRALFNRLSLGNLKWAINEFQAIHTSSDFTRHKVKSQLWTALEQSALRSSVPDNLLLEHAGFMALINADVDEQWGSFLLNRLVHCENKLNSNRFVAALCKFKLVPLQLVADFIATDSESLPTEDVAELCFSVHRLCPTIRKVEKYRSLTQSLLGRGDLAVRSKVLLNECLRKKDDKDAVPMVKIVQNLASRPLSTATVTSTYNELRSNYLTAHFGQAIERRKIAPTVTPIARKLRMNTGVRATILNAVIQSEDYLDATGRLLQLKLTRVQRPEIINVLMVMMLKEKSFNPFYSLLIDRLSRTDKSLLIITKRRTWEKLREPPKRPEILAEFISELLRTQTFKLSVLKAVHFVTMDLVSMNMVRRTLLRFFEKADLKTVTAQVLLIVKDVELGELCKSLRLFIQKFINNRQTIESRTSDPEKAYAAVQRVMLLLKTVDS